MTPEQIAYLIARHGGLHNLRTVALASGRIFLIHSEPGVPGRYSIVFDDANTMIEFHTRYTQGQDNAHLMVDYADYGLIENVTFFE